MRMVVAFPDLFHSDAGTTAEERRDAILARNARVHALNHAVHPVKEGGLYRLIGGCGGEHDPAATNESGPARPLTGCGDEAAEAARRRARRIT